MKLKEFNEWLTLTANIGVLAGIVFLALEVQQSNNLLEREIALSQQDTSNGQFINSEYLPAILNKIDAASGVNGFDEQYIQEFDLTKEEATRWVRYINQIWREGEANWEALGRDSEICRSMAVSLNRRRDHVIYWENRKQAYIPEFADCVENAR